MSSRIIAPLCPELTATRAAAAAERRNAPRHERKNDNKMPFFWKREQKNLKDC